MSFKINNRRYTGSKTKIVNWIKNIIIENCQDSKSFFDIFGGTGVVTASVIDLFDSFYINDFLYSNEIIYTAFFGKQNFDTAKIMKFYKKYKNLDSSKLEDNYVSINFGDKYFQYNDALKIGFIREDIERNKKNLNKKEYAILLTSLLYSLDRCSNTVGHYEAYFKNKQLRSSFVFELIDPIITSSADSRNITIFRDDANKIASKVKADVVYIDPPYSSRQYSRFYHVLETIVKWDKPQLSGTALKPPAENMSAYCSSKAADAFRELIFDLKCKYILVSYNNTYDSKSKSSENKMSLKDIQDILELRGKTTCFSIKHQPFNAGKTDLSNHQELLFLVKVGEKND